MDAYILFYYKVLNIYTVHFSLIFYFNFIYLFSEPHPVELQDCSLLCAQGSYLEVLDKLSGMLEIEFMSDVCKAHIDLSFYL